MQLHCSREWKVRWVLAVHCRALMPLAPGTGSLICCAISQRWKPVLGLRDIAGGHSMCCWGHVLTPSPPPTLSSHTSASGSHPNDLNLYFWCSSESCQFPSYWLDDPVSCKAGILSTITDFSTVSNSLRQFNRKQECYTHIQKWISE